MVARISSLVTHRLSPSRTPDGLCARCEHGAPHRIHADKSRGCTAWRSSGVGCRSCSESGMPPPSNTAGLSRDSPDGTSCSSTYTCVVVFASSRHDEAGPFHCHTLPAMSPRPNPQCNRRTKSDISSSSGTKPNGRTPIFTPARLTHNQTAVGKHRDPVLAQHP